MVVSTLTTHLPRYDFLRIFGCQWFVLTPHKRKGLSAHGVTFIFWGLNMNIVAIIVTNFMLIVFASHIILRQTSHLPCLHIYIRAKIKLPRFFIGIHLHSQLEGSPHLSCIFSFHIHLTFPCRFHRSTQHIAYPPTATVTLNILITDIWSIGILLTVTYPYQFLLAQHLLCRIS